MDLAPNLSTIEPFFTLGQDPIRAGRLTREYLVSQCRYQTGTGVSHIATAHRNKMQPVS